MFSSSICKQSLMIPVLSKMKFGFIIRSWIGPFASCVEIKGTDDRLCWISWNWWHTHQSFWEKSAAKMQRLVIYEKCQSIFPAVGDSCCCWCHFTEQEFEGSDLLSWMVDFFVETVARDGLSGQHRDATLESHLIRVRRPTTQSVQDCLPHVSITPYFTMIGLVCVGWIT